MSRAKALLTLTDRAVTRVKHLVQSQPEPTSGLFLSTKSGGCAGFQYDMRFVSEGEKINADLVEQDGAHVFIDNKALFGVIGSTMDYEETTLSSGFVFDNPNAESHCGCGVSYSLKEQK